MRVAFVVGEFPNASETFILRQLTGLADRGHVVEVYAHRPRREPGRDADVERHGFVRKTCYRAFGSPTLGADALANADIVHAHFGPQGLLALRSRKRNDLRVPIVTSFHGYDAHVVPRGKNAAIYDLLFQHGDWFTANTDYTAGVIRRLGCPREKLSVLPMGLRLPEANREPRAAGAPRRLLTVARHVEKKGLEDGLRAFARLCRSPHDVVYDLVGAGPLTGRLHQLCAELEVAGRVRFHGAVGRDRVGTLMEAADVFVLPSVTASDGDMEGQALVLQEAQSYGVPVVSTWHNGIPEGVWHRHTGLLVLEHDVEGLRSAIDELLADEARRLEMGRAAVAFVREHYDGDRLDDELVQLYQGVIAGPRRPRRQVPG